MVIKGLLEPAVLEAVACREAQALAQDLNLQHLFITSDCEQAVKHIQQKSRGEEGGIIKEIHETTTSFISCTFNYESRVSNFEAHKLARYGVYLPVGRHIWLGIPHDTLVIPTNILDDQ